MKQKLLNYQPFNEQEEKDKELLLKVIEQKDVLTRKNTIGHFTVSCWVLNQSHDKVLIKFIILGVGLEDMLMGKKILKKWH